MLGRHALSAALVTAILSSWPSAQALARSEEGTIRAAHEVLAEFLNLREQQIPASLLAEAHGVAIIPDVIKLGLVVGGQHGKGVLVIRQADGTWRGPMFVTLTGGSVGWQIGAQATDFVLVFKSQKSVENLQRGKFTLGADASVAAGPVGRRAGAGTDAELKAEIYSYSRNRGLFAGVSLDGSALQIDEGANAAYYGTVAPGAPAPQPPEAALKLVSAIAQLCAPHSSVESAPQSPLAPGLPPPPVLAAPTGPLAPQSQPEVLQAQVKVAWEKLSPLLDDTWRRYLAFHAQIVEPGRHPSPSILAAALQRFDIVASGNQYRALSERPEFQTVHGLLKSYYDVLYAGGGQKLTLPPPPSDVRR